MIVKCSRGGGGNSFWHKPAADHHMYDYVRNAVANAVTVLTNQGHTFEIAGLLYLQGESNNSTEASEANTRFRTLLDNLRVDLPTATGLKLHVVHHGADRHPLELHAVAHRDVGALTGGDRRSDRQPLRRQDVALLAIGVVQQRDVGRAVGVVLDRRDLRGHAVLAALEVDSPVGALGPPATMARGLAPVRVAPAALLQPFHQR